MRMFIIYKNKYLSNDMKIFGTCSIPLIFKFNKNLTKDHRNMYKMDISVYIIDILDYYYRKIASFLDMTLVHVAIKMMKWKANRISYHRLKEGV